MKSDPRRRAAKVFRIGEVSSRASSDERTLTVEYPTAANGVPDGGDERGLEAAVASGRRGQRRHGATARVCASVASVARVASVQGDVAWCRGGGAPSTGAAPRSARRPLEIIDGRAGSGRCNKQTAAIRGAVTQPRQAELNADTVCCRPS